MDCTVISFTKEIECLNLHLKNINEKIFNMTLILAYYSELKNGFIVEKQYKTTKKGTKFKFKSCKSIEEAELYSQKLKQIINDFNEEYNTDYCFD